VAAAPSRQRSQRLLKGRRPHIGGAGDDDLSPGSRQALHDPSHVVTDLLERCGMRDVVGPDADEDEVLGRVFERGDLLAQKGCNPGPRDPERGQLDPVAVAGEALGKPCWIGAGRRACANSGGGGVAEHG